MPRELTPGVVPRCIHSAVLFAVACVADGPPDRRDPACASDALVECCDDAGECWLGCPGDGCSQLPAPGSGLFVHAVAGPGVRISPDGHTWHEWALEEHLGPLAVGPTLIGASADAVYVARDPLARGWEVVTTPGAKLLEWSGTRFVAFSDEVPNLRYSADGVIWMQGPGLPSPMTREEDPLLAVSLASIRDTDILCAASEGGTPVDETGSRFWGCWARSTRGSAWFELNDWLYEVRRVGDRVWGTGVGLTGLYASDDGLNWENVVEGHVALPMAAGNGVVLGRRARNPWSPLGQELMRSTDGRDWEALPLAPVLCIAFGNGTHVISSSSEITATPDGLELGSVPAGPGDVVFWRPEADGKVAH